MQIARTLYHQPSYLLVAKGTPVMVCTHGPLTRYVKLQVAHVLGMPGMFSPSLTLTETAS